MLSEDFYRILADGNINLSDKEKTKINKLYENMKEKTLPYMTVLKALTYQRYLSKFEQLCYS